MARAVEPLLLSISIDDAEKSEIDPLVPFSVAIARVKLGPKVCKRGQRTVLPASITDFWSLDDPLRRRLDGS